MFLRPPKASDAVCGADIIQFFPRTRELLVLLDRAAEGEEPAGTTPVMPVWISSDFSKFPIVGVTLKDPGEAAVNKRQLVGVNRAHSQAEPSDPCCLMCGESRERWDTAQLPVQVQSCKSCARYCHACCLPGSSPAAPDSHSHSHGVADWLCWDCSGCDLCPNSAWTHDISEFRPRSLSSEVRDE